MPHSESKVIVVVAPHPDDETLGCGATLLKHSARGDLIHWIVFTDISVKFGFNEQRVHERHIEIQRVADAYGFASTHRLGFPTMRLDQIPMTDLVGALSKVVRNIEAHTLYIPYRNDAHSDHAAVFDACVACAKTFRYPSVRSVRAYETLSETDFGLKPEDSGFRPNLFVDVASHIERKLEIMSIYQGEMGPFPFPRSETAIRALSQLRGIQCGSTAAEAFMVLREIE